MCSHLLGVEEPISMMAHEEHTGTQIEKDFAGLLAQRIFYHYFVCVVAHA